MWCCFKISKVPEMPEIPPQEVPEKVSCCLEDPPTPITETLEIIIAANMVEPFILDHSTISMEPCEITEN